MLENLFTGKILVPDFKTLAPDSAIILDFVDQEFLPSQQCNISSLCHKTNRNRLNRLIEKKTDTKPFKIGLGRQSTSSEIIFEIKTKSMLNKKNRKKSCTKKQEINRRKLSRKLQI